MQNPDLDPIFTRVHPLSDEDLRARVTQALAHDAQVDASHIDVHVINGVVFLRGFVKETPMKFAAESCAKMTDEVADVRNELNVGEAPPPPAAKSP